MIEISSSTLRHMLQQVTPHMDDPENYIPVISSIHLEARDGWLYAVATDRFTIAVARRGIVNTGDHSGVIPGRLVPALTAWLDSVADLVSTIGVTLPLVPVDGKKELIFTTSGQGSFSAEYDPSDYEKFPNWRKILHDALTAKPKAVATTGFTTKFLARWQHATPKLVAWQNEEGKPFVFLDEVGEFAGLHMPVRHGLTRSDVASDWIAATAPKFTVDERTYDLTLTWEDRDGDPWTYSGDDMPDGTPLMVVGDLVDDPHPLDRLVWQYGPLIAQA
ncbi:phiSA1p31-related protein [Streptomyces sp. NPDC051684]|uniref:phiSA1p31-related protein n=1 Tax=Streptomyces sp. NPDC051684 TaxID=3365670 RepID=UPI00379E1CE8